MTAQILDGKKLAQEMRAALTAEVAQFAQESGVTPGLATVLVGENHPGRQYVAFKEKACADVGIGSFHRELVGRDQQELLDLIARLNADPAVHGILVQMPLPKHLDTDAVIDAVDPLKDVDGFGPASLGLLAAGRPRYLACTPYGILQILKRYDIPTTGAHVVVAGRSNIVGKPLALMLARHGTDATVTLCHTKTRDLGAHTRQADVVVMAAGQAEMLKADMVRPGAAVIDVGTNFRTDAGGSKNTVGDVDFAGVSQVAGAITPVPGGVGPMTITMLLVNTLQAARLQRGREG